MPIVKNKSGLEKVFVDNLSEIGANESNSGRTDIADSTTKTFMKVNNLGEQVISLADKVAVNTGGSLQETTASVLKPNTLMFGVNSVSTATQYNPIRVDGGGVVSVSNVSTTNIAPANSLNSHITDDPANSIAVGLTGRTTIGTATTQTHLLCDASGKLEVNSSHSDKIRQGYDTTIASGGDGLQQVLIYGRENGGDLRALECNGDRLIVDCIELSPTGPHTPTSLPSVAIHGQVDATSGFKNLRVNSDGRLETVIDSKTKSVNQYASQSLSGNGAWATTIDASGFSKCSIAVNSNATTGLFVYGSSTSGGTYIPFKAIFISSEDTGSGTHNVGFVEIDSPPDFMQIYNVDAGGVTLDLVVTLSN